MLSAPYPVHSPELNLGPVVGVDRRADHHVKGFLGQTKRILSLLLKTILKEYLSTRHTLKNNNYINQP